MEKDITTHLKRFSPIKVTKASINFQKIGVHPIVRLVSLEASLESKPTKSFTTLKHWRFSKKAKCLMAGAIIAVFLISVFAFLPKQGVSIGNVGPQSGDNSTATATSSPTAPSPTATSHGKGSGSVENDNQIGTSGTQILQATPPPVIESAQTINSTVWREVAENAWTYFQPGGGVNVDTGLPFAGGPGFQAFTDWDLGCYIQAVIDARELGLIGEDGAWGFDARINYVLTFLENRPLDSSGYPFQFYNSATGDDDFGMNSTETVDGIDTGRLFVALNNLINYNSSLQQTVDNIVLYGRSNYTALLPAVKNDILTSTSIYSYYIDSGFASFWPNLLPNPSRILNNIFAAGTVTTYGDVSLPEAAITGDPLLCSVFELNNNSSQLMALSKEVYLASEAYYNATGDYAAFSEGNGPSNVGYIYEWVVSPNGDAWKITGAGSDAYLNIEPIIYNKVAFSFLALYNTTYARNMVIYLEQTLPYPTYGYYDGADNSGNIVMDFGSNTNSLILDAATYAIQK